MKKNRDKSDLTISQKVIIFNSILFLGLLICTVSTSDAIIGIQGTGTGEVILNVTARISAPVFSGEYNYDIIGINIPPISTPWKVIGSHSGYAYDLPSIYMPSKPNNFTVSSSGVENLNIALKKTQRPNETRIWFSKQVLAKNDTATIESDLISPGIYHVKIFGDAAQNVTRVNMTMSLVKKIIVNGRFNLSINTTGFPSGNYSITARALNGSLRLNQIELEGLSAL